MPRLEKWSCCPSTTDPYTPPECIGVSLQGEVYGHPRFDDGEKVVTSQIVSADGKTITTSSGSVYVLGEVSASYREWLAVQRPNWDPENPITFI